VLAVLEQHGMTTTDGVARAEILPSDHFWSVAVAVGLTSSHRLEEEHHLVEVPTSQLAVAVVAVLMHPQLEEFPEQSRAE
jgi:hypothetical protein